MSNRELATAGCGAGSKGEIPFADEALREAYGRVVRGCVFAGLTANDAADVAQDFFLWLLQHPERVSLLSAACLGGVITNYVMRHRRRALLREWREGGSLDRASETNNATVPASNEVTMSIVRLERLLPAIEKAVLKELRLGATWAEAAAKAGIPPGSRDWLRKRMASHVREAFSAGKPREATRSAEASVFSG